jgi:hypothetical protein
LRIASTTAVTAGRPHMHEMNNLKALSSGSERSDQKRLFYQDQIEGMMFFIVLLFSLLTYTGGFESQIASRYTNFFVGIRFHAVAILFNSLRTLRISSSVVRGLIVQNRRTVCPRNSVEMTNPNPESVN